MDNNNYFDEEFSEDINLPSKKFNIPDPVDIYGNLISKNLAKIIKCIAYVVAILNLVFGAALAYILYKNLTKFVAISFGIVLVFAVFSAIFFFLIYAVGRVLEQNDYIIKHIN